MTTYQTDFLLKSRLKTIPRFAYVYIVFLSISIQQWPQDWKMSVFIPIPTKDNAKECSNYCTIALISHASKVTLKILQAGFSNT